MVSFLVTEYYEKMDCLLILDSPQIAALQEINKKLQEYNASLQVYNAKMQSDATMAAETISKIQKEKSSMMETLSSLRGHSVSLQEQLNQAKVKPVLRFKLFSCLAFYALRVAW